MSKVKPESRRIARIADLEKQRDALREQLDALASVVEESLPGYDHCAGAVEVIKEAGKELYAMRQKLAGIHADTEVEW